MCEEGYDGNGVECRMPVYDKDFPICKYSVLTSYLLTYDTL